MAYDRQEWHNDPEGGTPINASALDHIEEGIDEAHLLAAEAQVTANNRLESVVAGDNVTVDDTDPLNPIVSAEAGGGGGSVSDTAYDATTWNGVTDTAPSQNAVRDKFESLSYQPLDSDLTAIAALSTTAFGRGLLALANAAALLSEAGVTASAAEVNLLDGVTASTAELNHVDGVTSAIQTQLDGKQPLDSDLTAIAALSTTATGRSLLAAADAAAIRAIAGSVGLTGNETVAGVKTFSSDPLIPDEAYDATGWNGSLEPPTKNAVRDKIESLSAGSDSLRGKSYLDSTPVTVTNDATRQTYIDLSLDSLQAGDVVDFRFSGTITNNTGANRTAIFGIALAGTNLETSATGTIATDATARRWVARGRITVVNASNDVDVIFELTMSEPTTSRVLANGSLLEEFNAQSINVGTTPTLALIATMSLANASFSVTCNSGSAVLGRT